MTPPATSVRSKMATLVGFLSGITLTVVTVAGAGQAVAATPANVGPPGPDVAWSDCIFDNPLPQSNANVNSFGNPLLGIGVTLTCGNHDNNDITGFGVRHIRDRHGFDDHTEACIDHVVSKATSLTPGSGPRNEAFTYIANGVSATVVYNVDTFNIVTAFTQGGNGGNWVGCDNALR